MSEPKFTPEELAAVFHEARRSYYDNPAESAYMKILMRIADLAASLGSEPLLPDVSDRPQWEIDALFESARRKSQGAEPWE